MELKTKEEKGTEPLYEMEEGKRESIKEEFFGDYLIEIWDDETIKKYYKDKELESQRK